VDGLKVLRHVANLSPNLPEGCIFDGDVDCDQDADAVDALKILRYVARLLTNLPPGCPPIGPPGGLTLTPSSTPTPQLTPTPTETPTPTATPNHSPDPSVTPTATHTPTPIPDVPLQVHHIDVEQGDAALIVTPDGQVAMVDDGRWTSCSNTVNYVQSLGITTIAYHFATHYDADHIGCLDDLVAAGVSVGVACYDRGGSKDTAVFDSYVAACGAKRQTATKGQLITLGAATITVVDLNGAGVSTSDENALGLVLKVSYGAFDHEFGGDLPGEGPDIESVVGPEVGDVEVYKVHHHGSASSNNDNWLNATTPEVGIVSVGGNPYGRRRR